MRTIELLSPARTYEHGIEAINHGADAVYIGAPQFSARANASNTISEIEQLIQHAHKYYAKVYVALNTILTEEELVQAEKIIHQLYTIGTDALIVQDMGITQLNLPPIALHASTQMDNRTAEKVQFLEKAGFEQVVLARELSIDQIKEIHEQTNVKLEGFVHGALCVCYSGQCYLSQHICGRSANRGVCAQLCRLPYSLKDSRGQILAKDKYLLSLKDFNLSDHLAELIEAGISSLKIEGRLKDMNYVKNVTAYYRRKLDAVLEGNNDLHKASSGTCQYTFIPSIEKSFHRGSTDYFLHGRTNTITSFHTPKSLGEKIGKVIQNNGKTIIVSTNESLHNGDGFCYLNKQEEFCGFKANTVDGNKITPAERIDIQPGTILYRNFDQLFEKLLDKKSAERKISATIQTIETDNGFSFAMIDEDNNSVQHQLTIEKEEAKEKEKQKENIVRTLKKCGDTQFCIQNVELNWGNIYFIPATILAETRRKLISLLEETREINRKKNDTSFPNTNHTYVTTTLDYRGNVHNLKARCFYTQHGVEKIDDSLEINEPETAELMRCKHCIKYALGYCTKEYKGQLYEPLYLVSNTGKEIQLSFDCKHCEMVLKQKGKRN